MIVTITHKSLTAKINTKGAELISFSKNDFNYIWKVDENFWNKTSPVLFPIVGSLKNNEYKVNNKSYKLNRHGFARDCEFQLIEQKDSYALFCLKSNETTFKIYPFNFELLINYEIKDNKLIISYKVINHSKTNMPFNIGAHPAFKLQYSTNEYTLEFNALESLITHRLDKGLFIGTTKKLETNNNTLILKESLFEKDALVFKNINSSSVMLKHLDQNYLKINFINFHHLGIWKKLDAPFLCLEPWTGYSDKLNSEGDLFKKESIQILKPNTIFECKVEIEV